MINTLLDFVLHLDKHLNVFVQQYGGWSYALLFLIVFCETGLVVAPFLPGDSLLFAAGALAASSGSPLNIGLLFVLLAAAAIGGDTLNYWIGHRVGPAVFRKQNVRVFNREHLDRTQHFYDRYGGKTIVLARFIPIVRTFAPFVAGVGQMHYTRFIGYNVLGGVLWVGLFLFGGYQFGALPSVQRNFGLVVIAIILISVAPAVFEVLRHRMQRRRLA